MDRRIGLRRCGLVESLECRTFLDATVSGVPAGDVVITGTDGDDVIEVSGGAGGTVIVVNGVTTTGPSTLQNLRIDTLGGNDRIFLHDLTIDRDLEVNAGAGADDLRVFRTNVGSDVDLRTNAGADFLFVSGLTAGDDATFQTGLGNDRMTLSQIKATDDVRIEAQAGDDVAIVGFITGKRVVVAGGGGTDQLGINPATITGELRIRGWENVSSPST